MVYPMEILTHESERLESQLERDRGYLVSNEVRNVDLKDYINRTELALQEITDAIRRLSDVG